MKAAYSASELAGLAGMPGTQAGVRHRAQAEQWPVVLEAGSGTRALYVAASLPPETQAALAWRHAQVQVALPSAGAQAGQTAGRRLALRDELERRAELARRQESLASTVRLSPAQTARMDARVDVLAAFARHQAAHPGTLEAQLDAFVAVYADQAELLGVRPSTVGELPRVSAPSLRRWRDKLRKSGPHALAGDYGQGGAPAAVDAHPELQQLVVALIVTHPHCMASHVMQAIRARFEPALHPSERALQRWMRRWREDNAQTLLAMSNPDAWKNKHMAAFGSQSEGVTELNGRWELDSSPADLLLTDGRHSLIGVIDVYTRRMKLLVSRTSKATAVAALVRLALLDWGVPTVAKTDNGSDYTSHHIVRVFTGLAVDHQLCPPFQPWHKPHIERGFHTVAHDLVELLPGFIGHNVAERSAIEARKSFADRLMKRGEVVEIRMDSDDLQEILDRWTNDLYAHNPHSGLGDQTPWQVAQAWTGETRRITDERALDVLLAEAPGGGGWRTVQKKGIQLEDAWHIAPELEQFIGQRVRVLLDEHDQGRVYVFGGDDLHFVAIAECPERTGISRREVAVRARELQKTRVQEERRALKAAAKKAGVDDIVGEILRSRAEASGKLHALPKPSVEHTSPGLVAAAQAAAAGKGDERSSAQVITPVEFDAVRARIARLQVPQGTPNAVGDARAAEQPAPQFNSVSERVSWLLDQAHLRALTTEEQQTLADFKHTQRPSYVRLERVAAERAAQRKPKAGPTQP